MNEKSYLDLEHGLVAFNSSKRVVDRQELVPPVATSRSSRPVSTAGQSNGTPISETSAQSILLVTTPETIPVASSKSKPGTEYSSRTVIQTRSLNSNSNNNKSNGKDTCRRIEVQMEPSLMPPYRIPPPAVGRSTDNSEDRRGGVPSSLASTTSSFLEAAATPPILRSTQESSVPGAVCVLGLARSFGDNEHDNLRDMDDEDDNLGTTMTTTPNSRSAGPMAQSPQSASFSFYGQHTTDDTNGTDPSSMSIPIVAELAPTHSYNEQDVEDRVAERLEAQIEAQISERLQQEVDLRFSREVRQHAIAEVVVSSNNIIRTDNQEGKRETEHDDENFKICGIRRTWWGMILCVVMLLIVGGVAGTYLWLEENNSIYDGSNNGDNDQPLPQKSLPPTIVTDVTDNTLFPVSPMPSSPGTTNLSKRPDATVIPDSLINVTDVPTRTPLDSNEPSIAPITWWDYLITRIGPYVVPEEFVDDPEMYFVADANGFRTAALEWMATTDDLESDALFAEPIQVLVERYALAVLYFSTGGNQTWDDSLFFLTSSTVCDWNNDERRQTDIVGSVATADNKTNATLEDTDPIRTQKGVFCSDGSQFVTSIEIPDNRLQGTIPWELSLLQYLIKINFDYNKLYGSIPIELSRLSRLQALWLKANDLTGELPREFATTTQLASIDLEENSLSSTLPSEWGSLSDLFYLNLRLNTLTGTLPSEWRMLNGLQILDLEGNRLDGTLPPEYGELTELEALYLESNRFEGPLPPSFGNLTKLVNLFVDGNRLTGTVPAEYSALADLEFFWFHGTALTGSVESTLCSSDLVWRNNGTTTIDLRSNCLLRNDLDGVLQQAQIECSCCTSCCDTNGENCVDNSSR